MFKITRGRGFHITFANGYTVSVQFGPGNYCANRDFDRYLKADGIANFQEVDRQAGEDGSATAETAVLAPGGDLIECPLWPGDTVQGHMTAENVLVLMLWASSITTKTTADHPVTTAFRLLINRLRMTLRRKP